MNNSEPNPAPLAALLRSRFFYLFAAVFLAASAIILVARFGGKGQPASAPQIPATQTFEAAVAQNPSFENLVGLSVELIRAGRHREAIATCDRALKLKPGNPIALNNKATAQVSLREVGQAEQNLALALKAAPDFALAKNNLNWASQIRRDLEKEVSTLREQESAPQTPEQRRTTLFELASTQFLLGDYQHSNQTYFLLLKVGPRDAHTYNNIGVNQMMMADYAAAILSFSQAVKLDPSAQLYANNLRWAQEEQKNASR